MDYKVTYELVEMDKTLGKHNTAYDEKYIDYQDKERL